MKPWKAYEYAVAAYFGARRRQMRKFQLQGPDVNQAVADIEVKTRKHIPSWLTKPLSKTKNWSKSKIAAVIWLNPKVDDVREGVVVLGAADFKMLLEAYTNQVNPSLPSPSEQSLPPRAIPSKWVKMGKAKFRWKSRRLTSRKFSS